MKERKNNIFIISAPSGTGKSTLIQMLLAQVPSLFFSISHTTRRPREGEKEGVEYFFLDQSKFEDMIQADEFLEWARVHGDYYGTSRHMVRLAQEQEKDLLLDVDVQGAAKVRKMLPEATSIFILPPSLEELQERLVRRQQDGVDQIQNRLENARKEIKHYGDYDYIIINEALDSAFENLVSIVRSQRCKREASQEKIDRVLKSFGLS